MLQQIDLCMHTTAVHSWLLFAIQLLLKLLTNTMIRSTCTYIGVRIWGAGPLQPHFVEAPLGIVC